MSRLSIVDGCFLGPSASHERKEFDSGPIIAGKTNTECNQLGNNYKINDHRVSASVLWRTVNRRRLPVVALRARTHPHR